MILKHVQLIWIKNRIFNVLLNIFLFNNWKKNRMLADFYIRRLSNDMKITVQKNHLGSQILYKSPDPVKKRHHYFFQKKFVFSKILNFTCLACFMTRCTDIPPLIWCVSKFSASFNIFPPKMSTNWSACLFSFSAISRLRSTIEPFSSISISKLREGIFTFKTIIFSQTRTKCNLNMVKVIFFQYFRFLKKISIF